MVLLNDDFGGGGGDGVGNGDDFVVAVKLVARINNFTEGNNE